MSQWWQKLCLSLSRPDVAYIHKRVQETGAYDPSEYIKNLLFEERMRLKKEEDEKIP